MKKVGVHNTVANGIFQTILCEIFKAFLCMQMEQTEKKDAVSAAAHRTNASHILAFARVSQ